MTVELTPGHTVQTISIAFVNTRPIVKITGFGYTNAATGTPTSGIVSGTVTYTVTLHNYGGASTTLSHSSLVVSSNATCSGGNTLALTGTIAAASDGTPYSLTCTYSNLADGAQVSANLTVKYTTNALEREASGSPALVRFTAQAD